MKGNLEQITLSYPSAVAPLLLLRFPTPSLSHVGIVTTRSPLSTNPSSTSDDDTPPFSDHGSPSASALPSPLSSPFLWFLPPLSLYPYDPLFLFFIYALLPNIKMGFSQILLWEIARALRVLPESSFGDLSSSLLFGFSSFPSSKVGLRFSSSLCCIVNWVLNCLVRFSGNFTCWCWILISFYVDIRISSWIRACSCRCKVFCFLSLLIRFRLSYLSFMCCAV